MAKGKIIQLVQRKINIRVLFMVKVNKNSPQQNIILLTNLIIEPNAVDNLFDCSFIKLIKYPDLFVNIYENHNSKTVRLIHF